VVVATLLFFVGMRSFYFGDSLWTIKWLVLQVFLHTTDYVTDVLWFHFQLSGKGFESEVGAPELDAVVISCLCFIVLSGLITAVRLWRLMFGYGIDAALAFRIQLATFLLEDVPLLAFQIVYFMVLGFDNSVLTITTLAFSVVALGGFVVLCISKLCCCGRCDNNWCLKQLVPTSEPCKRRVFLDPVPLFTDGVQSDAGDVGITNSRVVTNPTYVDGGAAADGAGAGGAAAEIEEYTEDVCESP
jgi:hypothetical protein